VLSNDALVAEHAPLPIPSLATPPPLSPRRLAFALALLPAVVAVVQLGRLHPDEVYQSLEPALNKAYGYGILAWEWTVGLRNWSVPLLLSGLFRFGDQFGLNDPIARRALVAVPLWALHGMALFSVYRFAERRLPARRALWAMGLIGLWCLVVTWAGRTMSESISAGFLVWALERLDVRGKRKDAALGGALLGLSVVARYGSAVFVAAAMLVLLAQRRWKDFSATAAAGLLVALGLGWLDLVTWGHWFHSFGEYVNFNVISGQSAQRFGAEAWWYYLPFLGWLAPWAWPGLFAAWKLRAPRIALLLVPALAYVVAVSATAHKEARFLYPALVLLAIAGTIGTLALLERPLPLLAQRGLLALCFTGVVAPYFFSNPAFDAQRPEQFRLMVKAGREATGILLGNEGIWGAPGYFYVGKNIPWFPFDFPNDGRVQQAIRDGRINRLVIYKWGDGRDAEMTALAQSTGFKLLETQGDCALWGR
jgi:GPI mannosyltransferase 3